MASWHATAVFMIENIFMVISINLREFLDPKSSIYSKGGIYFWNQPLSFIEIYISLTF